MTKVASPTKPYRIGDKIKIQYSTDSGEFISSFGIVINNTDLLCPQVKYQNLSNLPIQRFNRIVRRNEIEMVGNFPTHKILPI